MKGRMVIFSSKVFLYISETSHVHHVSVDNYQMLLITQQL